MSNQSARHSKLFSLVGSYKWRSTSSVSSRRSLTKSSKFEPLLYDDTDSKNETIKRRPPKSENKFGYDNERMKQERSTLLELFALSSIPGPRTDLGVKFDEFGQLHITDAVKSRQKYKTALAFTGAPISIVERDFRRLLDSGKLIEGWKSEGGLEEIIPVRDRLTLQRKNGWILVFATPAAAQEYQARIHSLRVLLRHHLPVTSESKLQLPPAYSVRGSRGFTLQDYTIGSPWQHPSVIAHLTPFSKPVQEAIDLHHNLHARQSESRSHPAQISLDIRQIPALSTAHIIELIRWDGENRKVPWQLAEISRPITHLTGDVPHKILPQDSGTRGSIDNWRVLFRSSSEARRFTRAWNRKPLPRFVGLPYCDPRPLLHVECLSRDEGY